MIAFGGKLGARYRSNRLGAYLAERNRFGGRKPRTKRIFGPVGRPPPRSMPNFSTLNAPPMAGSRMTPLSRFLLLFLLMAGVFALVYFLGQAGYLAEYGVATE